jgi:nitroreductase
MIEELIQKRKSIRQFNNNKVPDKIIYQAINVARFAPSGKNRQPWKLKILSQEEKTEILKILENKANELKDTGSLPVSINTIKQSSHTILVYNTYSYTEHPYSRNRLLMDTQSIGAFIQNLLLYLTQHDIASAWINDIYYAKNELENLFNENKYELIASIAIGYSDIIRRFNMRKPVDEVLL